jgi:hypothetical protein
VGARDLPERIDADQRQAARSCQPFDRRFRSLDVGEGRDGDGEPAHEGSQAERIGPALGHACLPPCICK